MRRFHAHAARRGMLVWPRPCRRPEGGVCGYLDAEERRGSYHTQLKTATQAQRFLLGWAVPFFLQLTIALLEGSAEFVALPS